MTDYPNVPNLPGVPTLYRDPTAGTQTVPYQSNDTGDTGDTGAQKWGLFTVGGGVALMVDSVVEVDYTKEYNVPTYPLEMGSFESYNKVELPYEATLIVAKAGSVADRAAFQTTLDGLLKSLDLFNLVTPEKTYENANLVGLKIGRSATKGAAIIVAEIQLHEIRIGAAAEYANTKSDNAADTTDTGAVQTQTPSSATVTAASTKPNTLGGSTITNILKQAASNGINAALSGGNIQDALIETASDGIIDQYLQTIPVLATQDQTLTSELSGQSMRFNVRQLTTGLFMDILKDDVPVVTGVICQNANNLVRDAYLGMTGDVAWFDTEGTDDLYYAQAGARWTLNYLTAPGLT